MRKAIVRKSNDAWFIAPWNGGHGGIYKKIEDTDTIAFFEDAYTTATQAGTVDPTGSQYEFLLGTMDE